MGGASATALAANDFNNADVAVVAIIGMSASDYANFSAVNLAPAF